MDGYECDGCIDFRGGDSVLNIILNTRILINVCEKILDSAPCIMLGDVDT